LPVSSVSPGSVHIREFSLTVNTSMFPRQPFFGKSLEAEDIIAQMRSVIGHAWRWPLFALSPATDAGL
jgi:hypothetical protein